LARPGEFRSRRPAARTPFDADRRAAALVGSCRSAHPPPTCGATLADPVDQRDRRHELTGRPSFSLVSAPAP
jgi:hypothetical protein